MLMMIREIYRDDGVQQEMTRFCVGDHFVLEIMGDMMEAGWGDGTDHMIYVWSTVFI